MIRKEEIDQLFTSNHHFLKKVLGHISAQYNEYVHRSIDMQSKTMIQRLAAAIVFVLNKVGVDQKTNELKAYLKRKEWALLAHMNTSNVIRSFGALQTDGIVATDNKKLVIIDKKQLLALAE
jgi:CRP-like cAMP-binding protein